MTNKKIKHRYELASEFILNKLPHWKREAIKEDRKTGNVDSHVMDEFAKEVIALAESDKEIFTTTE